MESGLITVFQPLDRERTDLYFLNITLYDQGLPQKSSWRLLTINIEDTNDNKPQFPQEILYSYTRLAEVGKQKIAALTNLVTYYCIGVPVRTALMFAAKLRIIGKDPLCHPSIFSVLLRQRVLNTALM